MSKSANSGKSFDCLMCGHCCEGTGGIVVSEKDLQRLCAHLDVTPEEFAEQWGVYKGEKLIIRTSGAHCIFFVAGKGCGVHLAKPDICRAWPYFRGNLVDEESLSLAKDFCPGIPQELSHEDFVDQGLAYLHDNGLSGRGGADEAAALQIDDLSKSVADSRTKR